MPPITRAERSTLAAMAAVVVALHVVGFGLLFLVVVPAHLETGAGVLSAGVGITAYMLGVRHAFDADHIAAIDATTRKLMGPGPRPLSVGFWFSLGHSSVVFGLAFLLCVGVKAVVGPVRDDSSTLHEITGVIGPTVSGTFLCVIAALNIAILAGLLRTFGAVRRGECGERELAEAGIAGGPMSRLLGRATRAVRRPRHMYPLGLLFGLGFDTATEVSLLLLAGGAAGAGLPWWAVLCLPVLFAAGMSLFDTADGALMALAYGWGLTRPVRRLYYNVTVTTLSIVVALGIGSLELLAVAADRFGLTGGLFGFASRVDLGMAGYAVVGLFAVTWAVAAAGWRLAGLDERWTVADRRG